MSDGIKVPGRTRVRPFVFRAAVVLSLALFGASCSDDSSPEPPRSSGSSGAASPTASVSTTPSKSETGNADLAFAVIGDFGSRSFDQLSVAARMCDWLERNPYDLVITTGDNIYPDGDPKYFEDAFFKPYKCLLDAGVQWHVTLGNHDIVVGNGEAELSEPAFGMNGRNYVVRENGVRFVLADSNELDRAWLDEALEPQPGDRWTVVAFHHPVLSPGLHGSTPGFEDVPDLFVEHGVDLVVNGHDHVYAVTKPQDGLRYVVTGGGGAELYPCLPNEMTDVCKLEHHFLFVEADDVDLEVTAVPAQGPPFHSFTTRGLD